MPLPHSDSVPLWQMRRLCQFGPKAPNILDSHTRHGTYMTFFVPTDANMFLFYCFLLWNSKVFGEACCGRCPSAAAGCSPSSGATQQLRRPEGTEAAKPPCDIKRNEAQTASKATCQSMWKYVKHGCWQSSRSVIFELFVDSHNFFMSDTRTSWQKVYTFNKKSAWSGQLPATAEPEPDSMKQGREVVGKVGVLAAR